MFSHRSGYKIIKAVFYIRYARMLFLLWSPNASNYSNRYSVQPNALFIFSGYAVMDLKEHRNIGTYAAAEGGGPKNQRNSSRRRRPTNYRRAQKIKGTGDAAKGQRNKRNRYGRRLSKKEHETSQGNKPKEQDQLMPQVIPKSKGSRCRIWDS